LASAGKNNILSPMTLTPPPNTIKNKCDKAYDPAHGCYFAIDAFNHGTVGPVTDGRDLADTMKAGTLWIGNYLTNGDVYRITVLSGRQSQANKAWATDGPFPPWCNPAKGCTDYDRVTAMDLPVIAPPYGPQSPSDYLRVAHGCQLQDAKGNDLPCAR